MSVTDGTDGAQEGTAMSDTGALDQGASTGASAESTGEPSPCSEVHPEHLLLQAQADIEALSHLREVRGNLTITGGVTSLQGLGCLETVRGSLLIEQTQGLQDLTGLDRLADIGGQLVVTRNPNLQSLEGLSSLRFVSVIRLVRNGLTTLGLSHLQAAKTIVIGECALEGDPRSPAGEPLLEDFDGLESLLALQSVEVYDSPMLASLSGLEAFAERGGSLGSLQLWLNETLDAAAVAAVTDAFDGVHVDVCGNEDENADNCFCPPPS
jgi:hypothetical protein